MTNSAFVSWLKDNIAIGDVFKGNASGDEMSAVKGGVKKALDHAKEHNFNVKEALKSFEPSIKAKTATADAAKKLFDTSSPVVKELENAIKHLGDEKTLTKGKNALNGIISKAETLSQSLGSIKPNDAAHTEVIKAQRRLIDDTIKGIKDAAKKLNAAKPTADSVSAAQSALKTASGHISSVHSDLGSSWHKAAEALESTYGKMRAVLTGEKPYWKATGGVHPVGHEHAGKPVYKELKVEANFAEEAKKASDALDKAIDPEKLAKDTKNYPHASTTSHLKDAGVSTAAKEGLGFVERIKANFAKDKSIWSKGLRVAGVGVGAALTLDAFRSKDKEGQERGFVGRLAEGAAGLGVAAGSLALGGR